MGVGVLRLSGSGRLSGSNRPNGFVSDYGLHELLSANSGERAAELLLQDLFLGASLPFLEGLSDAEYRLQLVGVRRDDLLVNEGIGFSENLSPFAVPKDDILDEELAKHRRAYLAGVGSRLLKIEILRPEADLLRSAKKFGKLGEASEGRRNDDLHGRDLLDLRPKSLEKILRLRECHVHLPVRSNDFLPHGMLGG